MRSIAPVFRGRHGQWLRAEFPGYRCRADDRLVVVHSFSKSFLMTGWRLGWLVMPSDMTHHVGKLIEFNTSCASVFTQRAGVVALERTADVIAARGGASQGVPRPRALAGRGARRAGGAASGRHVCLFQGRQPGSLNGHGQAAGG